MAKQDAEGEVRMVALLRGINVGGKNLLPMKDLAHIFAAAGCGDVRTYIQSGNVVFSSRPDCLDGLADRTSAAILKRFGLRVPVVLRTAAQLAETIAGNPFLRPGVDERNLHVYFLADAVKPEHAAALDPDRSPPDTFVLLGRDVYLLMPNGMGRTKLTNAYFDKKLETTATARNWRTVLKLHEMLTEL